MDDDLLLGSAPAPAPVADPPAATEEVEFGDDLAEYLAAATEEEATTDLRSGADASAEEGGDNAEAAPLATDSQAVVPTLPDGRPITSITKKQAKAELDKKAYKAWKKAMKDFGGVAEGSDDEHPGEEEKSKKEKKDKSDKKEKKDKKDKKHKKRDRHDGGEDIDALAAELEALAGDGEALEGAKRRRREKVKARHATMDTEGGAADGASPRARRNPANSYTQATAKKLSKDDRDRVNTALAQELVQRMAAARISDAVALSKSKRGSAPTAAPIARLMLRDEVLDFGRKADNEVPLVRVGFLAEIAHWILDGASGELAPLDLRDVAYELLLRYGFKGSLNATHPNRVIDREDLNAWMGIGKEELETTTLGKAVNTSRQHQSETARNRQRAVTLLQRLSKAFSGGDDDEDAESDDGGRRGKRNAPGSAVPSAGPLAVRWPCERDATILTPYEYISNATEVFQSKVAQVDPLDPESYLRVPPLRIRKTPIR